MLEIYLLVSDESDDSFTIFMLFNFKTWISTCHIYEESVVDHAYADVYYKFVTYLLLVPIYVQPRFSPSLLLLSFHPSHCPSTAFDIRNTKLDELLALHSFHTCSQFYTFVFIIY